MTLKFAYGSNVVRGPLSKLVACLNQEIRSWRECVVRGTLKFAHSERGYETVFPACAAYYD